MKKLKYKIEYITSKEIKDVNYLKQSVFNGNIFVFRNFSSCKELNNITNNYFQRHFGVDIKKFLNKKNPKNFDKKELIEFQEKIKNSAKLLSYFCNFLLDLNFDIKETSSDKITFRYSPPIKKEPIGNLKPTKAHRDTWASNVFNQINWWIPLHNVEESNSIFIVPDFFDKKVDNDSNQWSFEKYKKLKNYPSTPVSKKIFTQKAMVKLELKNGDVLCFSGNHVHGSMLGKNKRINLETRTICSYDEQKFIIPKNIDSYTKKKKTNWFSPLKK